MPRGRFPVKALEAAMKIAVKRGLVRMYERGPGSIATFTIVCPALLAEVRIKRLRRMDCTTDSLNRDAASEIAGLKMYPSCPQISRELWGVSQDYFIRFFRVMDTGVIELGSDGEPLPAGTVVQPDQVTGPLRYLRRRRRELAGMVKARKLVSAERGISPSEGHTPTVKDPPGSAPTP